MVKTENNEKIINHDSLFDQIKSALRERALKELITNEQYQFRINYKQINP